MDKLKKEIGHVLMTHRRKKNLRGQDVADMLGVTKAAVHYWESGKRAINADTLIRYCEVIGVDPSVVISEVTKNAGI